jgi:CO/xanthine dehydrogenase Mo-binding subunit
MDGFVTCESCGGGVPLRAGAHEVVFVRSPVAHACLRSVTIPQRHKSAVFTADQLTGVKPIRAATSVSGLKQSREPILAVGKVRFVGEIIAACIGRSRAEFGPRQESQCPVHFGPCAISATAHPL